MFEMLRKIAEDSGYTSTLDLTMFYIAVAIVGLIIILMIIKMIDFLIDELTEYIDLLDLVSSIYFKIIDYIKAITEHKVLMMHFNVFEELFRIDPTKWRLCSEYTEYYCKDAMIEVRFYPWEMRRYKCFIAHKENKPYGIFEKLKSYINLRKEEKVKSNIENRNKIQKNMERQLRALSDMQNSIAIDIKKANENIKVELSNKAATI